MNKELGLFEVTQEKIEQSWQKKFSVAIKQQVEFIFLKKKMKCTK